jgi:hypothetical protein
MPRLEEDLETIIAAVPGFRPIWEGFLKEYADEKISTVVCGNERTRALRR